jgi:hypothetical protein
VLQVAAASREGEEGEDREEVGREAGTGAEPMPGQAELLRCAAVRQPAWPRPTEQRPSNRGEAGWLGTPAQCWPAKVRRRT